MPMIQGCRTHFIRLIIVLDIVSFLLGSWMGWNKHLLLTDLSIAPLQKPKHLFSIWLTSQLIAFTFLQFLFAASYYFCPYNQNIVSMKKLSDCYIIPDTKWFRKFPNHFGRYTLLFSCLLLTLRWYNTYAVTSLVNASTLTAFTGGREIGPMNSGP